MNTEQDGDRLLTVNGQFLLKEGLTCIQVIPDRYLSEGVLTVLTYFTLGYITHLEFVPDDVALAGSGARTAAISSKEEQNKGIPYLRKEPAHVLYGKVKPATKSAKRNRLLLTQTLFSPPLPLFFHFHEENPGIQKLEDRFEYRIENFQYVRPDDCETLEKRVWHNYMLENGFKQIARVDNKHIHRDLIEYLILWQNNAYSELRIISGRVIADPACLESPASAEIINNSQYIYVKYNNKEKKKHALRKDHHQYDNPNQLLLINL